MLASFPYTNSVFMSPDKRPTAALPCTRSFSDMNRGIDILLVLASVPVIHQNRFGCSSGLRAILFAQAADGGHERRQATGLFGLLADRSEEHTLNSSHANISY